MTQENSKFYLSEVLLAIGHLHKNGYIYRDLKPENILIDSSGHIRLADFGLAKKLNIQDEESEERTNTFWGTPEYLSPEIINHDEYSVSVDFWSFGVLMYMMLSGIHPFASNKKTKKEMLEDISNKPVEMLDCFSEDAKELLTSLLDLNPAKRLGMKIDDIEAIKNHQFFWDFKWDCVEQKEIWPPFVPELAHAYDTSYMDRKYTAFSVNSKVFNSTVVLDDINSE